MIAGLFAQRSCLGKIPNHRDRLPSKEVSYLMFRIFPLTERIVYIGKTTYAKRQNISDTSRSVSV
jgi:hypothetical protein